MGRFLCPRRLLWGRSFKFALAGACMGFVFLTSSPAFAPDLKAWEASINPQTKERHIPIDLWSGMGTAAEPLIAGGGQEIDYTIDKVIASVRKLWRSSALRASF